MSWRYGEHRKELIKLMRKASGKNSLWNVFDDFCTMTAISIANSSDIYHVATSEETWQKREQKYLEIIGKYDETERALFPQMVGELVGELEERAHAEELTDVLGEVFHELELHNKWRGQFFTPQHVCNMMGRMVLDPDNLRKKVKAYGYVSINEPACGAGAMLYGFANAARKEGFSYCHEILFVANDVDERCVNMAYVQCSLYGFPAVLVQQNTLSLETYGAPWYSPVYIFEGWHWREKHAHDLQLANEELTLALSE